MNQQATENTEDIIEALHAGRVIRNHGPYHILIGDEQLQFSPRTILDAVPTGAQILEAAGIKDPVEYAAYRILQNGLLEELRPDETTGCATPA